MTEQNYDPSADPNRFLYQTGHFGQSPDPTASIFDVLAYKNPADTRIEEDTEDIDLTPEYNDGTDLETLLGGESKQDEPVTPDVIDISEPAKEETPEEQVKDLFEPSLHTVNEVLKYLETVDDEEKLRVLALEEIGKNRSSIINA